AYNALDSPRFSDEENPADDGDDLLGEELEDAILAGQTGASKSRSPMALTSTDVSTQVKNLTVTLKSSIEAAPAMGSNGEASLKELGLSRPKGRKKKSKKKEAGQARQNSQ
ncbi:unnamed protein product, partial [Arabidopsis halleri]